MGLVFPDSLPEFDNPFKLKLVIGDLQGLPEIFYSRHPTAADVRTIIIIIIIIIRHLKLLGMWIL